jgi:nicotinate-nucleotide adenylyltransferase
VAVAADVADGLALDRVLWIPAREPPHKRGAALTRPETRLAMVRAAVTADPRFETCTVELDRPGPSYMVDTVRDLSHRHPEGELFLIMGADEFAAFGTWRSPEDIVRLARLAVMDRAGASARAFRRDVPGGDDAVFVPVRRVDVSATAVRERRRSGGDVRDLVPPGVAAIIERERLYSSE